MASKFVLILFLTNTIEPAQLGVYGLFVATIGLGLYLLGLELHVVSARDLLARPKELRSLLIRDQALVHLAGYILIIPLLLVAFLGGQLPLGQLLWFYLILILEHAGQEVYRLLVTFGKPLAANASLFLRGGAWVILLIAVVWGGVSLENLNAVWGAWACGSLLGLIYAISCLSDLEWSRTLTTPVDWGWLRSVLRRAVPFLFSALAIRSLDTVDRYALGFFHGEASVGIYTFYYSFGSVLHLFIYSGVVMILHPQLISSFQEGDLAGYRRLKKRLTLFILFLAISIGSFVALALPIIIDLLGRSEYGQDLNAFRLMLVGQVLLALGYIPFYDLYVRNADKAILFSSLIACVAAVTSHLLLVPAFGIIGTAIAAIIAFACLTASRWIFAKSISV